MVSYCNGTLKQVEQESREKIASIEKELATRRQSIGATPVFVLVEYEAPLFARHLQAIDSFRLRYAHKLTLPDEIMEHPSIKEIERIGTDLVVL